MIPHHESGNIIWHYSYDADIERYEDMQCRDTKLIKNLDEIKYT